MDDNSIAFAAYPPMSPTPEAGYPVTLSVEYPGRLGRLSTAFRLILAIPIVVVLTALVGAEALLGNGLTTTYGIEPYFRITVPDLMAMAGLLVLPTLLMIVFRGKYPRWWFDWNLQLLRLYTRVYAYLLLLRDEYPSTDDEQGVHLHVAYPDARQLSRWQPPVKWLLALPDYLVVAVLTVLAIAATVVAWFAILITG